MNSIYSKTLHLKRFKCYLKIFLVLSCTMCVPVRRAASTNKRKKISDNNFKKTKFDLEYKADFQRNISSFSTKFNVKLKSSI